MFMFYVVRCALEETRQAHIEPNLNTSREARAPKRELRSTTSVPVPEQPDEAQRARAPPDAARPVRCRCRGPRCSGRSGGRNGRGNVEPANHLGRQIEAGIGPDNPGVERAEQNLELLLLRHLLNDRSELLLELDLELGLQILNFLLRVVGEALDLGLLPIDVLFELRTRRVAEHAGSGVELLLRGLQRLVLLVQLGDLLGC